MVEAILALVAAIISLVGTAIKGQQQRLAGFMGVDIAQIQYQQQTQLNYQAIYLQQQQNEKAQQEQNKQIIFFLIVTVALFLLIVMFMRKK